MRVFFQSLGGRIGAAIHRGLIYGAACGAVAIFLAYMTSLPPRDLSIACGGILGFVLMLVGLAYAAEWTGSSLMTFLLAIRLQREVAAYVDEASKRSDEVHEDEPIDINSGVDTLEAFVNATEAERTQFIPPEPSWYYPSVDKDVLKLPDDLEEP